MNEARLLPCPFCGGMPLVLILRSDLEHVVRVECSDCRCSTPSIVFRPDFRYETIHNRLCLTDVTDLRTARKAAVCAWNLRWSPSGDKPGESEVVK